MKQFEPQYETLVDVFDRSVRDYGPRELFGTKKDGRWVWLTYADFGALVARFRSGLGSLGLKTGDRVAIISNNRVEWAVAAYASYGVGAALVPMYEAQSAKDWEFIVRDCGARALIVSTSAILAKARPLLDTIDTLERIVLIAGTDAGDSRITTYDALLSAAAHATPAIRPTRDDLATILYTSGTTGNPKGVVLSHGNIASNVSGAKQQFPIRATDRSLSILPWAHAFGQTADLHMMFASGAGIAICEGNDKILDNLAEVKPTILACVPAIFNRVYTAVRHQLSNRPKPLQALVRRALLVKSRMRAQEPTRWRDAVVLRLVDKLVFEKVRGRLGGRLEFAISGGAALSREVAEFIDSIGITVFEGYGLTETSPTVTVNGPGAHKMGSVGRPLPGVRVEIDPAAAEHNSAGDSATKEGVVEGEVVVFGPNVMKGYFKRPEETAAVFTSAGGFRTGDMGYVDADGFLFITGRIKEQYKLENGKYVVPSALEEALKLSPYVANVLVFGDNKPYNVALVVANVPVLRTWAAGNHVALPEKDDLLLTDERVRELFARDIEERSKEFKRFERIQDFVLVSEPFSVENGMLTPKMSVKRRKVIETYGTRIERLYERRAGAKPAA